MTALLYRYRESTFRRYEPALAKIVDTLPHITLLNPKDFDLPLNVATCAIYLRATSKSLFDNEWKTFINVDTFRASYPLVFSETSTSGLVISGTREAIKLYLKESGQATRSENAPSSKEKPEEERFTIFTDDVGINELLTFISLATKGSFTKPIKFKTSLPQQRLIELEEQHNVALIEQGDGFYLLIA